MMTNEEINSLGEDDLRNALREALAQVKVNSTRWCRSEDQKMRAMQMANSARIRIRSVQSIRHLLRHMPQALGSNAEPNIDIALIEAAKDLDRADELADVLPF